MSRISYHEAIMLAQKEAMRRDERVFVMGQDIQSGLYGDQGFNEFGPGRVRNVPVSEAAFYGAAIGAALTGMRPIIDATNAAFMYSAMDQIVSQAAKNRYMFGGQASIPVVFRSRVNYGAGGAAHHCDRPWATFMTVPGLVIVAPTTPSDVKGMLTAAILSDDPVIFFEDATLAGSKEEVPDGEHIVPLGKAAIRREGRHVTVVGIAGAMRPATAAAKRLADEGIEVELIDLRSLVPMDHQTILKSLEKTGRLVVVDPAPQTCGAAAELSARIVEHGFHLLRAPILRVTAADVPVPFAASLERALFPNAERIEAAVRRLVKAEDRVG